MHNAPAVLKFETGLDFWLQSSGSVESEESFSLQRI
jgi:hypothetical protein